MSWRKLEIESIVPPGVDAVSNALTSVNNTIANVLDVTTKAAQIVSLLQAAQADPLNALLGAAIDTVSSILRELMFLHGGIHYLTVPVGKTIGSPRTPQVPIGPGVTAASSRFNMGATRSSGGNLGFYNIVADSIFDKEDSSRPLFADTEYVTGLVVLVGASTFGELAETATSLSSMLGDLGVGLDANLIPVPQNLVARVVPSSGTGPAAVHLTWDPDPLTTSLPAYGGTSIRKKKIVIYRSEKQLRPSLPQTELRKFVISEKTFTSLDFNYIDTAVEVDKVYNYAVGYKTELTEATGLTTALTNVNISNQAQADTHLAPTHSAVFSRGTPPDWVGIQTPLAIFPKVLEFLTFIQSYVVALKTTHSGTDGALPRLIKILEDQAARVRLLSEDIQSKVNLLKESLTTPSGGVYVMGFAGVGGDNFFLSNLANELTSADANRPPFDTGTELVAGFVLMAGGGTQADLAGIDTLFSLISGSGVASNAIALATAGIDKVQAQSSALMFGTNLQPSAVALPAPDPVKTEPIC